MSSPLRTPLILSLAVNLALAGMAAGHFLLRPPPPSPYQEQRMDAVEEVAAQLPEEKAAQLRTIMARGNEDVERMRKDMKNARDRTTDILSAESFDAEAYQKEVTQLHELRGAMMQRMAQATMEAADALSPEERALLADTFRRYHGYWKKCEPPPHPPKRP